MPEPTHQGFHHLTLNVQDVEKSAQWYSEVLGFVRFAGFATTEFERVILRHPESGAMLGLSRHTAPVAAEPFDERRSGLDHLAFRVENRRALDEWIERFDAFGVPHSEPKQALAGTWLVAFRDPDGIQLEVFANPGPSAPDGAA